MGYLIPATLAKITDQLTQTRSCVPANGNEVSKVGQNVGHESQADKIWTHPW
jgi:hypothetical protein